MSLVIEPIQCGGTGSHKRTSTLVGYVVMAEVLYRKDSYVEINQINNNSAPAEQVLFLLYIDGNSKLSRSYISTSKCQGNKKSSL